MKFLSIVMLLLQLGAVSCQEKGDNNKPKSPQELLDLVSERGKGLNAGNQLAYNVTAPQGWTEKDTIINKINYKLVMPPASILSRDGANINIVTESLMGLSLKKYREKTEKVMANYFSDFKILGKGLISDNTEMYWIWYSGSLGSTDFEASVYIAHQNEVAFVITTGTKKGSFQKYRETFDAFARSFKFVN